MPFKCGLPFFTVTKLSITILSRDSLTRTHCLLDGFGAAMEGEIVGSSMLSLSRSILAETVAIRYQNGRSNPANVEVNTLRTHIKASPISFVQTSRLLLIQNVSP